LNTACAIIGWGITADVVIIPHQGLLADAVIPGGGLIPHPGINAGAVIPGWGIPASEKKSTGIAGQCPSFCFYGG